MGLPDWHEMEEEGVTRPDHCPNCGASVTMHTGSYCHHCGEPLVPESPIRTPEGKPWRYPSQLGGGGDAEAD